MYAVEYRKDGTIRSAMYNRLDLAKQTASRYAVIADNRSARIVNLNTGALVGAYVSATAIFSTVPSKK